MALGDHNPQGPADMIPILTDTERFAGLLAANTARTCRMIREKIAEWSIPEGEVGGVSSSYPLGFVGLV
ncbi:hypothetical protein [Jannaschia formosa]|uniref:hypothetical protein n=1 Tax=Jannaschia formosa TaxID=2259592 RepID=UPI000E1BEF5E|nr:hypothetical protein [Jannaschia formosa]TFL18638.1 hypothetical protein DR046_09180 [Jannaschia formosa]